MNISNSKYLQEWFYFVSILIVFVVMYYFTNRQYIKSYSTTFKGSKNLRIELVEIIKRLIVIENGKVENFGTHSYLLENSTRYRKLVECSQLASEYEY